MDLTDENPRVRKAMSDLGMATSAKAALDLLGEEIAAHNKHVDQKIFKSIEQSGKIDPDAAIQAWYDKYSNFIFLRGLQAKLTKGQSAGRVLAPFMEETDGQA